MCRVRTLRGTLEFLHRLAIGTVAGQTARPVENGQRVIEVAMHADGQLDEVTTVTLAWDLQRQAFELLAQRLALPRRLTMKRSGDQVELTGEEASGGTSPRIVRYVLLISLTLAILALSAIWITGALTFSG